MSEAEALGNAPESPFPVDPDAPQLEARPPREPRPPREERATRDEHAASEDRPQQQRRERTPSFDDFDEPAPQSAAPIEAAPVAAPAPAPAQTSLAYSSPEPLAPVGTYSAIIQHEDEGDAHKPVRKRRNESASQAAEPLQLVETGADVPVAPVVVEDELPRRTKPRRRRSVSVENEPLQIVETAAGADKPVDNPTV